MRVDSHGERAAQSSWVYRKQIDLLYEDLPFAIISTAVVVTLVFLFLSESVGWHNLAVWFALFCGVLIFRAVSNWLYSGQKKKHRVNYPQAEKVFIAGVVMTGVLWAGIGLWLFPELDLKGKILLFIVIMGIAAASNTTMGYRRAPIYIFTSLLILPLVIGVLTADFPNAFAVSIAMLVYMVFLLRTSTGFYRNNEKMLQLQEASIKNEQKLLIQSEKAELANQAKSEFLSLMSHELRTPLNTVLGLNELQLLDRDDRLTMKQRKRAIKIYDAGRHLLSLVNDVLDFSRIETGEVEVNLDVIDSQAVLRDALKMIEGKANSRRISVYIEEPTRGFWVRADYTRLKQVMVNLLDNAVKYNRPGGTITVAVNEVGQDHMRISVADTGYGIADHLKGELFKPFSRLDADDMGIEGTGIGLSFSKQLVELMNGKIGVESLLGQGSRFWVDLPRAQRPATQARAQVFPRPVVYQEKAAMGHGGGKLLLAEDNLVNQEVAVDMLEQSGFKVDVASNGEEVLRALRSDQYSLVLMDCEMPVMDGFMATEKLRQLESEMQLPQTPVVALTAHAIKGVRERCLASGMNDFLAKPFSFEEITSKVTLWTGVRPPAPAEGRERGPERAASSSDDGGARQQSSTDHAAAEVVPAFDPSALEKLNARKKYRKRELVKRVVGLYLEQTPKQLEELAEAVRQADAESQSGIAHSVKSSSLTVGAMALADTCKRIEELSKGNKVKPGVIDEFMEQYSVVEQELQNVLMSQE
jgi:signal transduction histidine kinase/DNA-binding NarL/FixJ family response regulator/HPt (histidine-containing phosphotransfer) domain-containing protein